MIHKVLSHGSSGNPFDYLLGKARPIPAELVRGDVGLCWEAIKSAPFRQKYTSLVLSFAEELTSEREREIIDDYERVAFSGRAEEFARAWVRHRDHRRTELHCVVANVHLPTGKRWSHYYDRADRRLFKSWQELTNFRHNLASPDAPERMRLADIPGKLPALKKALFEKVDALVCVGVTKGTIETRADLVKALETAGYRVATSRNFVAVTVPGSGEKALRLRGKKYDEQFSRAWLLKSASTKTPEQAAQRKKSYELDFADAMQRRTAFVTRVCRPRQRASSPRDIGSARDAEKTRSTGYLTEQLTGRRPLPPQPFDPPISNEPGPRTNLSARLFRTHEAGGRALLAARTTAWAAWLQCRLQQLIGAVSRRYSALGREYATGLVGVPADDREPFYLGKRLLARPRDHLKRREADRLAVQRAESGLPAATLGTARGKPRVREEPDEFSL